MIHSRYHTTAYDMMYRTGKVSSIGGRTHLIKYHTKFSTLGTEAQHCFHKVISKGTIEPCRTYDSRSRAQAQYSLLACQLSTAIN